MRMCVVGDRGGKGIDGLVRGCGFGMMMRRGGWNSSLLTLHPFHFYVVRSVRS
jgi:hypothetical protein